jgi:HPt (histidine-containing phosphotransfer) domain-containing protein
MWHVDPFLGYDHEINNEATSIDIQQLRKYATVLESLLRSGS